MNSDYLLYWSALPVILLLMFVYKYDTHKEPKNLLTKTFVFGCLTVIPVIIVELIFDSLFNMFEKNYTIIFLSTLIGVALVEELFKWLVVRFIPYKNPEFDESYDGIVYAVYASLGFALIENIFYVIGNGALSTAILRALTAVPGHACDAVVMGYFFGLAKNFALNNDKKNENKNILLALLVPTLTHTIYDYLIFTENGFFLLIWLIFVIVFTIICFILIRKSSKMNSYIMKANSSKYCKNCGNFVEGKKYCSVCGERTSNN